MEMLRAVRLVVDTGMHGLGWSWDRAYKYMLSKTAMSEQDAGVETTRYVTWPGQVRANVRLLNLSHTHLARNISVPILLAPSHPPTPSSKNHHPQACAYKIGQIEITRLRKKFEDETGDKKDVRDFYHVVLTAGAVPLTILEDKINELIVNVRGGGNMEGEAAGKPAATKANNDDFLNQMTFAVPAWCKCCVVPGSHGFATREKI